MRNLLAEGLIELEAWFLDGISVLFQQAYLMLMQITYFLCFVFCFFTYPRWGLAPTALFYIAFTLAFGLRRLGRGWRKSMSTFWTLEEMEYFVGPFSKDRVKNDNTEEPSDFSWGIRGWLFSMGIYLVLGLIFLVAVIVGRLLGSQGPAFSIVAAIPLQIFVAGILHHFLLRYFVSETELAALFVPEPSKARKIAVPKFRVWRAKRQERRAKATSRRKSKTPAK